MKFILNDGTIIEGSPEEIAEFVEKSLNKSLKKESKNTKKLLKG